jgi:hypothetical protein
VITAVIVVGLVVLAAIAAATYYLRKLVLNRALWIATSVADKGCPFVAANATLQEHGRRLDDISSRLSNAAGKAAIALDRLDRREEAEQKATQRVKVSDVAARQGW